jgi:nitrogen fixation/metabolism regulation signal transduction histidine kinase
METQKAAFMGKITAGVTHEILNVLAIIKESAGLLEDLLSLPQEKPPPRDKFLRTLNRIAAQVTRGVDLSTNLNAFAHTPDEAVTSVDLNQAVDRAASLGQRFARLKNLTLAGLVSERPVILRTDPLALQMLLFLCIDIVANLVEPGSALTLQPLNDHRTGIMVTASGEVKVCEGISEESLASSEAWTAVRNAAQRIDLSVEIGMQPPWILVYIKREDIRNS